MHDDNNVWDKWNMIDVLRTYEPTNQVYGTDGSVMESMSEKNFNVGVM